MSTPLVLDIEQSHDGNTPKLELKLHATHETYYSRTTEGMRLIVTAVLNSLYPITLHNQGQWNSYDETADEQFQSPENEDDEWGCEPGVLKDDCLEIQPAQPLVVTSLLEDMNPLCDPLIYALQRKDHIFKLKAKPQKLKWTRKTKKDLFGDGNAEVPQEQYDTWEDAVKFMVKAN